MTHLLSPTGVAVLLLLALVVDYLSVGPDSIRDRLAFFLALPAIYEGFNGSPLDMWTVEKLTGVIQAGLDMTGTAYIAAASASVVLGAGIAIYAIYTVGVLLPTKLSSKMGRFAAMSWPQSGIHRLNWQLWLAAILLGMLCDLPTGMVGNILRWCIQALVGLVSVVPNWLFGVS